MKFIQNHPKETVIERETYRSERTLKDDLWSVNILYRNDNGKGYVLKLTDARTVPGLMIRPLLMLLIRHEYGIHKMLADLGGVPKLGPRYGRFRYFHEYVQGKSPLEVSR